jgi:hypothetical protein
MLLEEEHQRVFLYEEGHYRLVADLPDSRPAALGGA